MVGRGDGAASERLVPQAVTFDSANGRLYIRTSAADDIFSLRLVPRDEQPERTPFAVSLDIIAAGRAPTDVQLFELDGVTYLLIVAEGGSSAVVVDVATSRTVSLHLPRPFDHARVYYTEEGGVNMPHALLWDRESGSLATLALSLSTAALDRSFELLPDLPTAVSKVVPFDDGTTAFITAEQTITLVNPARNEVTPYNSRENLSEGLFDRERSLFWLAPRRQARVAYLDLKTGGTDEMLLDQDVQLAALVPGAARLAVLHDNSIGHITFVDLDHPQRDASVGVRGFLANGLFE